MSTAHDARASEKDLIALGHVWSWESEVLEQLNRICVVGPIAVALQPIVEIASPAAPRPPGFEALARFPTAPDVPIGLWFRVAEERGIGRELELAAARAAVSLWPQLGADAFLSVKVSPPSLPGLIELVSEYSASGVVAAVPDWSLRRHPLQPNVVGKLRAAGIRLALGGIDPGDLPRTLGNLGDVVPEVVKIDVLGGVHSRRMRSRVGRAMKLGEQHGFTVIAERVEEDIDLQVLADLGVELAQGYCCGKPVYASIGPGSPSR